MKNKIISEFLFCKRKINLVGAEHVIVCCLIE